MKQRNPHRSTFAPRFERLEDRTMFACSVGVSGGVMTIEGDGRVNRVRVTDNGDGDLVGYCDSTSIAASDVHRIDLNTRGATDYVTYWQRGDRTRNMDLNVQLGDGQDHFTGTIGGDINYFRMLDIDVRGEDGGDEIGVIAYSDTDVKAYATLAMNLVGGGGGDDLYTQHRGRVNGTIRLSQSGGDGDDGLYASVEADLGSIGRLIGYDTDEALLRGNDGGDLLEFYVYKDPSDLFSVAAKVEGGEGFWFWDPTDYCVKTANVEHEDCEKITVV